MDMIDTTLPRDLLSHLLTVAPKKSAKQLTIDGKSVEDIGFIHFFNTQAAIDAEKKSGIPRSNMSAITTHFEDFESGSVEALEAFVTKYNAEITAAPRGAVFFMTVTINGIVYDGHYYINERVDAPFGGFHTSTRGFFRFTTPRANEFVLGMTKGTDPKSAYVYVSSGKIAKCNPVDPSTAQKAQWLYLTFRKNHADPKVIGEVSNLEINAVGDAYWKSEADMKALKNEGFEPPVDAIMKAIANDLAASAESGAAAF
jgi:hypothetical protein